ncbi:DUF2087 domain-containing protein [Ruegeria sp.]|uniref:DUF2087 domain-containing protein n=1 Tax=Ruegeria sp. TaxID=1879320 RepID=UPI00230B3E00|nr:DUF2087 domain-containing protein [Ruegeria sp.]MDA7966532.1 DUF2087 domain-containing protein [Ruegeria sp.]
MTKTSVPLHADDLTGFVRALSRQLGETSPSHLSLMNMVARAAGFQNYQHMRSASAAQRRLEAQPDQVLPDMRVVERALHQYDAQGRLRQWPSKRAVQTLSLWILWSTLPAGQAFDERTLNEHLNAEHLFSDPATLRRTMISCGLLTRRPDGSEYRRIEQQPTAEAKAAIRAVTERRRSRGKG